MTREQLVAKMAKDAGIAKKAAHAALGSLLGTVAAELKKGGRVALVGFGTFAVRKTKARTGRNPKTGKAIKIPAGRRPVFKAGAALKGAVKKSR
jgi:DNA-binding protein HU-beta